MASSPREWPSATRSPPPSRPTRRGYRGLARELERCQQEGQRALSQAAHWCDQLTSDFAKVTTAKTNVATAQTDVQIAQSQLGAATASPGAAARARAATAMAALREAEDRLRRAETELHRAQRALDHAEQELARWQRLGRQAFTEPSAPPSA